MAKHRAPRVRRHPVRRTVRVTGRATLATARGAWWALRRVPRVVRPIALATGVAAWIGLAVTLLVLSLVVRHGKARQALRTLATDDMLRPLVRRITDRTVHPRPVDRDPALWPPMGQLADDAEEPESIGLQATRRLRAA